MKSNPLIDKIVNIWLSPSIKLFNDGKFIKLRVGRLKEVTDNGMKLSEYVLAHIYTDKINIFGQHVRNILGLYTEKIPPNMYLDGMTLVSEAIHNENSIRQVWIIDEYAENVEVEFPQRSDLLVKQLKQYKMDIKRINLKYNKRYN